MKGGGLVREESEEEGVSSDGNRSYPFYDLGMRVDPPRRALLVRPPSFALASGRS
jgi:hypothetical protein